jgi:enamine deaminase RidA (YjgF/YER057c/UK114 family)
MEIKRFDITQPPGPRMSRCIVRGDTVYVCGITRPDSASDIKGQTKAVLAAIEKYLDMAGTNKSKLLTAQFWIKEMKDFNDMNSVWNDWVDPENPPVRACVRADMTRPETLIEIMVTAALK